jgi:hypothetical protein
MARQYTLRVNDIRFFMGADWPQNSDADENFHDVAGSGLLALLEMNVFLRRRSEPLDELGGALQPRALRRRLFLLPSHKLPRPMDTK